MESPSYFFQAQDEIFNEIQYVNYLGKLFLLAKGRVHVCLIKLYFVRDCNALRAQTSCRPTHSVLSNTMHSQNTLRLMRLRPAQDEK